MKIMLVISQWLIALLVPLALIGLALRILLTPAFYIFEYNMPYFPVDQYGFTKVDRLHWAPHAVDYLLNDSDISYLGDLKFDDGSPLFNERELTHMQDVKDITRSALKIWYTALGLLALLGVWAWRSGWDQAYLQGLKQGGWLMIGLAVTIGLIVLIGMLAAPAFFWDFFTFFHSLFFEGDSWLFLYSDTLIRLFPIRFWQDAFLLAAAISLSGGLALAFLVKPRIG
jgi:integral membrane protein (TIGR01906 family)